ncbi:MAG: hypothetical protein BAJALOKI1v1_910013 [Promethearchaeota archaeon]|nr:MAG: hypothetical protein BAJALOKI1v1_910013 [Candidatus Lokiarchaeota archaeon]
MTLKTTPSFKLEIKGWLFFRERNKSEHHSTLTYLSDELFY